MTICGLQVGQRARIESISMDGESAKRVRDMGLIPGAEFEVVGRAPLHDPVALRLNGFTLAIRNSEAGRISVVPLTKD